MYVFIVSGIFKIVFYNQQYLVIYQCLHLMDDHLCSESMDSMLILGKSLDGVDLQEVVSLYDIIDQQCFMFSDFKYVRAQGLYILLD